MNTPKFEKKNHHYVPQHWQRRFRGIQNKLFGRFGNKVKVVSPRTNMQQDWLYTVFDYDWNPSDALEDGLSVIEASDAELIQRLHRVTYITTSEDRKQLCKLLALQACRHPDVLLRGHILSKEFGTLLADAHSYSLSEFQSLMCAHGICNSDAHEMYVALKHLSEEQLLEELDELLNLSPQSPKLPAAEAIFAQAVVVDAISAMNLFLLEAMPPMAYVLSDTPIPQSDLAQGFSVPLSKSLAVVAEPASTPNAALIRRHATQTDVSNINKTQWNNAAKVVIGPSEQLLNNL